ncbi:MAG TPA: cell wall hydrolase [Caulobacterales bacterium]|nr:cell wall hydrolase [Caulobacterales bacterium]
MGANAYAMAVSEHVGPFDAETPAIAIAQAPRAPPIDPADVRLLAATAWAEARSEGEIGMRAVAHVVVNRVGEGRFGDSLNEVVLHPRQFSSWNRDDPNRPLALHPERYARSGVNLATWRVAQEVAREVLEGRSTDPTQGALFYHARSIRPYWASAGVGKRIIGHHVFYADVTARAGA